MDIYNNINMKVSTEYMSALMLLSDMHRELQEFNDSIRYMEEAIQMHKELGEEDDSIDFAQLLKTIADDYLKMEELDKGIEALQKALKIEKAFFGGILNNSVQETMVFLAEAYQYSH
mmetsp:Transcript_15258/g.14814  ORF Transcript_15258/g.14814 Transcript_15258/m.14814 type:complete len:117 (-) Transcript_15258:552-902(-)|eukprot:CAMPEP_0170567882 /NCGR_PEP_ID=MMETSP0211-20121228/80766_1 /TAXON_ID=311385 /ORGANISM="Pseudokeronopsis sp., Strain OXSARD2" /LENGTH=116 /DNA_ID=CAMNT_0010889475 /DNA_START=2048 /DNA_END=2398 /DNA_ORIENTATION=+